MQDDELRFPPGLWRRIILHPVAGQIVGGLEDDVHRFFVRIDHRDGVITGAKAWAERFPWSTCPGAAPFLVEQLVGKSLVEVAALDPYVQCTHLFELAVLCAAHAGDGEPIMFDLKVGDRPTSDDRAIAMLEENGEMLIRLPMLGSVIEGDGEWAGRDFRKLSTWRKELSPRMAERAMMLRRATQVSGARRQAEPFTVRAGERTNRLGACFTYQMPRAMDAIHGVIPRIDFSATQDGPLQGFDPEVFLR